MQHQRHETAFEELDEMFYMHSQTKLGLLIHFDMSTFLTEDEMFLETSE